MQNLEKALYYQECLDSLAYKGSVVSELPFYFSLFGGLFDKHPEFYRNRTVLTRR